MKHPILWTRFLPRWILANTAGWAVLAVSFLLPYYNVGVAMAGGCVIGLLQRHLAFLPWSFVLRPCSLAP